MEQLSTNVVMTTTIQRACHLLMSVSCHPYEGGFLEQGDLDCLVSLLNDSLLNEVLEERVLKHLCCNVATCRQPQMTEEEAAARRAL
jgi:hypothetical protein